MDRENAEKRTGVRVPTIGELSARQDILDEQLNGNGRDGLRQDVAVLKRTVRIGIVVNVAYIILFLRILEKLL